MRGILMYHSIDPTGSPISMAPEVFQRQLDWLAEERVRVVGLAELLELPDDAEAVALTFDDAFANFESEAWPRLAERELPATLFVVSGEVGRTNRWGGTGRAAIPELPLMDWAGLERVARAGVSIGTHSRTHPRFYGLDRGRLERELCGARPIARGVLSLTDGDALQGRIRWSDYSYIATADSACAASIVCSRDILVEGAQID